MRISVLTPVFVEHVPEILADGSLYIAIQYGTAVHRCCCGCGIEVVTPLSPTDWRMIFDGETVSLDPSIGNWSFPCRSHYWITQNKVRTAPPWSQQQVAAGRERDRGAKSHRFDTPASAARPEERAAAPEGPWWLRAWAKLTRNH